MGGMCSSSKKLRRFIRCSKCQAKNARKKHRNLQQESDNDEEEEDNGIAGATHIADAHLNRQIQHAFYAVADDPVFVSRKRFTEEFGPALGNALWDFLQGKDEKTMDLKSFKRHAKFLREMPKNTYAQMDMRPDQLLRACIETHDIMPSNETPQEIKFMGKLSEQMGTSSEQIIAWKDRNCPRLFQSIHEHVLNVFLGIPKSALEESKLEESELLSRVQMFFLKHNLPRKVFFDTATLMEEQEGENERKRNEAIDWEQSNDGSNSSSTTTTTTGWTKLYESANQGLNPEIFQEKVFGYDGSTVVVFQMCSNGQMFVLAVDERWKNSQRPFGGPYTVLFKFHLDFERFEAKPPALHCNFTNSATTYDALYFDHGMQFTVKRDLSNVKAIEAWGCAPFRAEEAATAAAIAISPEAQAILDKEMRKKTEPHTTITTMTTTETKSENGKKAKPTRSAVDEWTKNPDKQLLEMAGYSFSDKRRRVANKK